MARSGFLEEWAKGKLRRIPPELDLVRSGHTHVPVLKELWPGRYYLNSGDWLVNQSYAVLTTGSLPQLMGWRSRRAV